MLMIGIRQFFTRQNFPNPDSSKFSTVKNLRHTVVYIFRSIKYASKDGFCKSSCINYAHKHKYINLIYNVQ